MNEPREQPRPSLRDRLADHFAARDAEREAGGGPVDPAELWGRRVARALGAATFLGLVGWLVYQMLGGQ